MLKCFQSAEIKESKASFCESAFYSSLHEMSTSVDTCSCEINILLFWSEIKIFELMPRCEINILLPLKWSQYLWAYLLTWNGQFPVFEVKSTSLSCCVDMKSTFKFWSEINIFQLMHCCEGNILLFLMRSDKRLFCSRHNSLEICWWYHSCWVSIQEEISSMQSFLDEIVWQSEADRFQLNKSKCT